MISSRQIRVVEESQVGFARRCIVNICQRISEDETFCGRAAIVVTEMAQNLVRHGKGGEIVVNEVATLDLVRSNVFRTGWRSSVSRDAEQSFGRI
jgi:anti-sigma regulatory factor (Ser/Thr protein kinase)